MRGPSCSIHHWLLRDGHREGGKRLGGRTKQQPRNMPLVGSVPSQAHRSPWIGLEGLASFPGRLGIAISRLGILLVSLGLIDSPWLCLKKQFCRALV